MTDRPLPYFRYHPGAVANASFILSNERCDSCQQSTGYIYRLPVYRIGPDVSLCPWCIADGVVGSKYDGELNDRERMEEHIKDQAILDEVAIRTPAFHCWQELWWPHHCNDLTIYLTDVRNDVMASWFPGSYDTVIASLNDYTEMDMGRELMRGLVVDVECHLFQCRHCLAYEAIATSS